MKTSKCSITKDIQLRFELPYVAQNTTAYLIQGVWRILGVNQIARQLFHRRQNYLTSRKYRITAATYRYVAGLVAKRHEEALSSYDIIHRHANDLCVMQLVQIGYSTHSRIELVVTPLALHAQRVNH